jgi:uncharacterized protein YjbI with pentapeptide repeats
VAQTTNLFNPITALLGALKMNDTTEETPQQSSNVVGPSATIAEEDKVALECQKLRLEQQILRRQLSRTWLTMEWLKSATVLAALFGAALTFYVGYGQIQQAEQDRSADRFNKALARLSSSSTIERLTGVSGLRLFLDDSDSRLRMNALQFLVNAASIESDEFVQSAIINVFEHVKKTEPDPKLLNEILHVTLEQNRNQTRSIIGGWAKRAHNRQVRFLVDHTNLGLSQKSIPDPIPRKIIKQLTPIEYLQFEASIPFRFEGLKTKKTVPLRGLSKIISILIQTGATSKDFSEIYCERCDFRNAKGLEGANFYKAFLAQANFSHAKLQGASFKDSDLRGTLFFSTDLSGADLTNSDTDLKDFKETNVSFPLLECANLKGANLSGTPLIVFASKYGTMSKRLKTFRTLSPSLKLIKIDENTKLDSFLVVFYTRISDEYAAIHINDSVVHSLKNNSSKMEPLFGKFTPVRFQRIVNSNIADEAKGVSTMYIQYSNVGADEIREFVEKENTPPELARFFKGFLSQTALADTPLIHAFSTMIADTESKKDNALKIRNALPVSCEVESAPSELIDSGYIDLWVNEDNQ